MAFSSKSITDLLTGSAPPVERTGLQNLALGVERFAAGYEGDVQGQRDLEAAREKNRQESFQGLSRKRLLAMIVDARSLNNRLQRGDTEGALGLVEDRIKTIEELGGDPYDTRQIYDQLRQGKTDSVIGQLNDFEDGAVAAGIVARDPRYGSADRPSQSNLVDLARIEEQRRQFDESADINALDARSRAMAAEANLSGAKTANQREARLLEGFNRQPPKEVSRVLIGNRGGESGVLTIFKDGTESFSPGFDNQTPKEVSRVLIGNRGGESGVLTVFKDGTESFSPGFDNQTPKEVSRVLTGNRDGQSGVLTVFKDGTEAFAPGFVTSSEVSAQRRDEPKTSFDKKIAQRSAEALAGRLDSLRTLAEEGRRGVETANRSLSLVDQGIRTGSFAAARQEAARFFKDTFNISDDKVSTTDEFFASQGLLTATQARQFGSGSGITDSDRNFANRIVGGDITFDEKAIRDVIELQLKVNRAKISRYNSELANALSRDSSGALSKSYLPVTLDDIGASPTQQQQTQPVQTDDETASILRKYGVTP